MEAETKKILKKYEKAINEYVKPASHPIAVKMLKSEREIPAGAKRPKRDLKPMVPCQAFSIAKSQEIPIAMGKEDVSHSCGAAYFVFGWVDPPQWWHEGRLAYKIWTHTLEAGANMEKGVFRFPPGEYWGFVVAPIHKTNFDPDVVLLYCNAYQATLLVNGVRAKTGDRFYTNISGRNACSDAVVATMLTGQPQLTLPCEGDRLLGQADVHDLIFAAPLDKLSDIADGLKVRIESYAWPAWTSAGLSSTVIDRYIELDNMLTKSGLIDAY